MIEIITTIVLTGMTSTGLWTLILAIYNNRKAKKSTDRKALLALLHDKIYSICTKHIEEGCISAEEYENLVYLYEPYKEMGGNGTCERLMNEVNKLPLRRD